MGRPDALSVLANSSDATVNIPGTMKPHSIATHPAPQQASVIAWRQSGRWPAANHWPRCKTVMRLAEMCILYSLELRRGQTREVLATGESKGSSTIPLGPLPDVIVKQGDVLALVD